MTSYQQPELLDTPAGYAEAGNFPEAISTADRAAELACAAGRTDLAREIQPRLALTGKAGPIVMKPTTFQK
jgi:hypothetical protein